MTMPGFTAEASLPKKRESYRVLGTLNTSTSPRRSCSAVLLRV